MPRRLWLLLSNSLIRQEKINKSTKEVDLFIEQTNNIVDFLQSKFPWNQLKEEEISEIFSTTLSLLSKKNNPELLKKATVIFLNYIKKEFYFKQKNISDDFTKKINSNLIFKKYFVDYIREVLYQISNKNIEPWKEFSFIFFLYWNNDKFDLIKELTNNNINSISRLVNSRVKKININSSWEEIDAFCMLMEVINQLTLIQWINSEDKIVWWRLFHEVLLSKTKEAILTFISTKDKNLIKKIDWIEDTKIYFSETFSSDLDEIEIEKLNKLQNLYWKFYMNFSANLEYIKSNKKGKWIILSNKIWNILDKIIYWSNLCESSNYWLPKWTTDQNSKKILSIIRDWNIAFTKLIYIKKLEELKRHTPEQKEIINSKNLYLSDLIYIYSKICKWCIKWNEIFDHENLDKSINSVVDHFTSMNNPQLFQIITIYKLILFTEINYKNLKQMIIFLSSLKNSPSILFEKFKVKTFELVVQKITNRLTSICEKLYCDWIDCIHKDEIVVCNYIVSKIEDYISKNNRECLIYNYWKIYLILSLLYSHWTSQESQEKSKKYYHIFNEKYWDVLPFELKNITRNIYHNYAKFDLSKYNIDEKKIDEKKMQSWWEKIIEVSKEVFLLSETTRIQDWISKLILKIQNNEFNYNSGDENKIKTEICALLEKEIFNNLCKISIIPRWEAIEIWRFEKISKIENDFFDIIFVYTTIYENSFQYIFSQKKELIKNSVIQLIDIFSIHMKTFNWFNTIKKLTSKVIETKDLYTTWHIDRVKDISITLWMILWFNWMAIQQLETQAIMHDYWKLFIADEILKKPWKLTEEEFGIMQSHPWFGILEWINNNFEPSNLEGMAHHCFFYKKWWNQNLKYEKLIEKYKKDATSIHPKEFNELQWCHIPLASRIIMIWDVIDTIASRRVYDRRAWWSIEKIIKEIESELIECSWLIKKWNNIEINTDIWEKVEWKITTPCFFNYENEIYKPKDNVARIQFDPAIIYTFLSNKENFKKLKDQIIECDKKNVANKITEFIQNIEILEIKKKEFLEILNKTNWSIDWLSKQIIFSDEDEKDLNRLREVLPQLIEINSSYKKNK